MCDNYQMKVVLDTNVLIDGFKDEYSYQWRIIQEVINGSVEAFANNQTMRENRLIMDRLITDREYRAVLDKFFSQLQPVSNPHRIHAVSDTEDNKILESAVVAGADYLVTGDAALLELDPSKACALFSQSSSGKSTRRGLAKTLGQSG